MAPRNTIDGGDKAAGEGSASLAETFDRTIAAGAPSLVVRPEDPDDHAFLRALFVQCSPLAGLLPDAMVLQQAEMQALGHANDYPRATRRLVSVNQAPVGHVVIDWEGASSWCVDIAVLPAFGNAGIATALLSAWLRVSDAAGIPTALVAAPDNPALRLYRRLGFVRDEGGEDMLYLVMRRPVGG